MVPLPDIPGHQAARRQGKRPPPAPLGWLGAIALTLALALAPPAVQAQEGKPEFTLARFYQAAVAGNAEAQRNVGIIYAFGYGVPENKKEAARWLGLAANQGDAKAMYHLAWLYRTGQGVPLNYAEATRWETRSAERGYLPAMVSLARVHMQSNNTRDAEHWFLRAAAKGDPEARNQLIVLYTTGALCDCDYGGVDYKRGMAWVREMAEAGELSAMWGVAIVAEGQHRYREAYVWYMLAAALGHMESEQRALAVNNHLDAAQRASAHQEIRRRWPRINK